MPTTAALLDLKGIGQRSTSYRFELLDKNEALIGEVHPDRDLTPIITQDTSRAIQRDMTSFNLTPDERADVNMFSDRVRPKLVLEDGSEHPEGIFLFADPQHPHYSYGVPLAASLLDKAFIVDQPVENALSVRSGSSVREYILRLLLPLNIEVVIENTGVTVGPAMTWSAGTSRMQILTDLCLVGGYFPPYFDNAGLCRVRVRIDPELGFPDVTYTDGANVYAATPIESHDLLRSPNRFVVVGNDASDAAVMGFYDLPAQAPHSFFARGFRVVAFKQQQGLLTDATADRAARVFADSTAVFEYVSFAGPPDPRHDANSVVELFGERWLEVSWSLTMSAAGPMQHTLRKVYAT